jgi:hypothetical protein
MTKRVLPLLLAACASGVPPKVDAPPSPRVENPALATCAKGLDAVAAAEPKARWLLLAEACGAEIGFRDLAAVDPTQRMLSLAQHSDLICAPQAAEKIASAGPGSKMRALVDACGRAYYGLPDGAELSMPWFVFQRVFAWIGKMRATPGLDPALVQNVDARLARVHIPLDVSDVVIPHAQHADEARAQSFVLVTADAIRVGMLPVASVTGGKLTVEGGLPGAPVALDALATRTTEPAILIAEPALPGQRLLEVARALRKTGVEIAVFTGGWGLQAVRLAPVAEGEDLPIEGLHVWLQDQDLDVWSPTFMHIRLPRQSTGMDREGLAERVARLPQDNKPAWLVSTLGTASVQDLVDLLGLAAEQGARAVYADGADVIPPQMRIGVLVQKGGIRLGAGTSRVRVGEPTVSGDLDKKVIQRYIRQHIPQFQDCYEMALLMEPRLAGTVSVRFEIDGNGVVSKASATGVKKEVAECVAQQIQQIQFPRPPKGGKVVVSSYPFTFKPDTE